MTQHDELHILIIHGPNMNLVGKRPKEVFGTLTLDKIDRDLRRQAGNLGVGLKIFQSNSESAIVTKLQRQRTWADGILLNPTTLCFTSYTMLDTLDLINLPVIEIHLTKELADRQVTESLFRTSGIEQIAGPPDRAYNLGLSRLVKILQATSS